MADRNARALPGYAIQPGYETDSALREFQRQSGIQADGIWGPQTQAAYEKSQNQRGGNGGTSGGTSGRSGGALVDINHKSGYTGKGYTRDGNTYTNYGALLRDDDFLYPAGAKISPNGMYYDEGNGWQFAKQARQYDGTGKFLGNAPNSVTGLAPGSAVPGMDRLPLRSSRSRTETPVVTQPNAQPEPEQPKDDELARFWRKLLNY